MPMMANATVFSFFLNFLSNMKIVCSVKHCATCLDDLTCIKCNVPYTLIQDQECHLCEEGTYFNEDAESCSSISIFCMING